MVSMVASSNTWITPRRMQSCNSMGPKAFPCTLKSDMLNSNTVRSVCRTIFCWLRLPAIFRLSSLPMITISRSENLFLPIIVGNERFFTSCRISHVGAILGVVKNLGIYCNTQSIWDLLLVLVAQEVVYRLYRIECGERYLHEDGVPVTHCTIPQAGKFECLE